MSFKIGDYVKYISKCVDHHSTWLKLGEVYKICAVVDKSVQLEARAPSQDNHGFAWWVQLNNVVLASYTKKESICEKVREMDSRFKKKQEQKDVTLTKNDIEEFIVWISARQEEDNQYALSA